jgi:hypothetical protein
MMLKRAELRRYLLALLWHDTVPQGPGCETGFLWTNCDGERPDVFDHETHQLFEDAEASYDLRPESIAVVFGFDRVNYVLEPTKVDRTELTLWIEIVCHDASGRKRQDILDQVEERILYRLFSYQSFIDASTGDTLRSFMLWTRGNEVRADTRDDSAFGGDYTIRRMTLNLITRDCIEKQGCDDVPLCFDFTDLTPLDENC